MNNTYQSISVTVQAAQVTKTFIQDNPDFINLMLKLGRGIQLNPNFSILIQTGEGDMLAQLGYWIIIDSFENVYPIPDDVFRQKYIAHGDRGLIAPKKDNRELLAG